MMQKQFRIRMLVLLATLVIPPLLLASCASGGSGRYHRTYMHPGFSSHYYRPWGYRPIIIDGRDREVDPDWGVSGPGIPDQGVDPDWGAEAPRAPIAEPMPDLGMPDFGGMEMDMGGFD